LNTQHTSHTRSFKTDLVVLFIGLGLTSFGCSGTENEVDVCEGLTNQFVGESTSRGGCEASDRGEFIEGGCYCHASS